MSDQDPPRPLSASQFVAVGAATLALFFVVAFASKSLEAHRLRQWRNRLSQEIHDMERQRDALAEELQRSRSDQYALDVLRGAGWVEPGAVSVVVITPTPGAPSQPGVQAQAAPTQLPAGAPPPAQPVSAAPGTDQGPPPGPSPDASVDRSLFRNQNWRAWQRLIWGFD